MAGPPSQLNPLPTEVASSLLEGSKTHQRRMTGRALRAQHKLSTLRTAAILNEGTPLNNRRVASYTQRMVLFWAVSYDRTTATTTPLLCQLLSVLSAKRFRLAGPASYVWRGHRRVSAIWTTSILLLIYFLHRCYVWFRTADQDGKSQWSPEELRTTIVCSSLPKITPRSS